MIQPYLTDQIWNSECCDTHELAADVLLDGVIDTLGIADRALVHLVDALPQDLVTYPYIITDNLITVRDDYYALWPDFYGIYYWPITYQDRLPTKLYNCFINRTDPIRQSWMYKLVRENIFDQGLITYNLDIVRARELHGVDYVDQQDLFDQMYNSGNQLFADEHKYLKNIVPYQNINSSLEQAIIDSKIQLVLETYIDCHHAVSLSEKTFRALQLPRPFLLFASSGAVAHLRQCGFDVFDDLVNHSYDLITDNIQRQSAIIRELISWQNIQFDNVIQKRLLQGLEHNQNLLKMLNQRWPEHLQKAVDYLYTL